MIETKVKNTYELQTLIEQIEQKYAYKPGISHQNLKLTPSDKIMFACDYYNLVGNISILDVLKQIPEENKQLIRTIITFIIKYNLLKPYPDLTYEYSNPIPANEINIQRMKSITVNGISKDYNHQNWLELFDESAIFKESKTKHPSYRIFLAPNGDKIKFDKDLATKVKLAIIDEGIVPARCIVESAYPHVARGTFQEYTDKIKKREI